MIGTRRATVVPLWFERNRIGEGRPPNYGVRRFFRLDLRALLLAGRRP